MRLVLILLTWLLFLSSAFANNDNFSLAYTTENKGIIRYKVKNHRSIGFFRKDYEYYDPGPTRYLVNAIELSTDNQIQGPIVGVYFGTRTKSALNCVANCIETNHAGFMGSFYEGNWQWNTGFRFGARAMIESWLLNPGIALRLNTELLLGWVF